MIEMLHAAEMIKELLHDDDLMGEDLVTSGTRQERGVGISRRPGARSSTTIGWSLSIESG